MTRIESKMCLKCGSENIDSDKEQFVCLDCGLVFCLFDGIGDVTS